jgi:tRNA (guanine37-N1)-methyltransferase
MASYDVMGNVALFKFDKKMSMKEKKKVAEEFLAKNKHVTTVLEKTNKISGRLRTPKTKFVAGIKTKEVVYRENGCFFRFNIDTSYFSPRLAGERKEIAQITHKGEKVMVMFGGVAPFAVIIAKTGKPGEVMSIELNKKSQKYALENVKQNKVNVEVVQGDVRRKTAKMKEKFDRIVMARPNLKDDFLDCAFKISKKGTVIHYYGFYDETELSQLKELIFNEAKKAKKKIKLMLIKKAGDIGVRKYRYRADFKVQN